MLRFCRSARYRHEASFEEIAAAVAVALHLHGVAVVSAEELAAAIAVAVHLTRVKPRPKRKPERAPASGWAISGRMHHVGLRLAGRERALLRGLT